MEGHRPRVRRYAYELRKLIKIGQGKNYVWIEAIGPTKTNLLITFLVTYHFKFVVDFLKE